MAVQAKILSCVFALSVATAVSAADPAPTSTDEPNALGLTKAKAIEVCNPAGERQYLARLVCPNSEHPLFERIGSVGTRNQIPTDLNEKDREKLLQALFERRPLQPGEPDYHTLDAYSVTCGSTSTTLYLDMYHCGQEPPAAAPAGFTIR